MNIVGLGHAGCRIANEFKNFPQYEVFFIDTKNEYNYKNFLKIKEQDDHESYEKNYRRLNLKKITGKTTVVFSGTGKITGMVLRLLEQLKERELSVLYIKPDMSTASSEDVIRERIVFGVIQQYARSNMFSRLFVVSNASVEDIIDKVSIKTYWQDLNKAISSTYHMLNVFENTEPILSTFFEPGSTSKICTMGVVGYSSLKEKLFYKLEKPRLKKYFFGISEKTLNEEKDLLPKIRNYVKDKSEEECSSCFAIYSTDYEQDYVYAAHYASLVQEEKID